MRPPTTFGEPLLSVRQETHTAPVEHYGVDANKHCIWYPEDELEESSSDSSKEETEGASGGGDTVADEEDDGEEDYENLSIEHVDEMNNVPRR